MSQDSPSKEFSSSSLDSARNGRSLERAKAQSFSSPSRAEFSAKVVLVTNATRAIGRQIALCFGREGASLTIQGTSLDKLTAVKDSLAKLRVDERRVLMVSGPAHEESTLAEMVERTLQRFGKLDVLLTFIDLSEAPDSELSLGPNLRSLAHLAHLVERPLSRTRGCLLVLSGSPPARPPAQTQWHSIARAALEGWTRTTAQMLGPKGVRVNAISVGPIRADFRSRQTNQGVDDDEQGFSAPSTAPNNALRRTGTLEEVGAVVLFLASPRASFVSGQVVCVDGGMTADTGRSEGPAAL